MNTEFRSYRDLEVWPRAMQLAKRIYQVTQSFPNDERFGLTNQLRRASGPFSRFISIAMGSFAEIETQVILSTELGYIRASLTEELMAELQTLGRMLRGLAKSIDKRRHV